MHQFGLRVSEGRLVAPGGEFKAGKNDRNLQVLRQSLFLAFGKTSLLVGRGRGRDGAFGSHKLYNTKCELAYETLSTYGLAFSPSLN